MSVEEVHGGGIEDAIRAAGSHIAAQLCCRYFRPGGIVRGVIQLSAAPDAPSAAMEIAYVVAQIHAHVTVDSNLLSVPVVPLMSPVSASTKERENIEQAQDNTRFWDQRAGELPDVRNFSGETGSCIYLSAPVVLVSDLNIAPTPQELEMPNGHLETLKRCRRDFALALRESLCPTFRGTSARVFYVLSITCQSAMQGSLPVSIHLPFDVHAPEFFFNPITLGENAPEEAEEPTSPVTRRSRSVSIAVVPVGIRKGSEIPFELRPLLMHGRVETEQLQRAQTNVFTIGKEDAHLVRFLLMKRFYRPGDIVLGIFDFSRASMPCSEVSATLALEETLAAMALNPDKTVRSDVVASFHQHTGGAVQTNLRFCIPHDATPSIKTDLVCFRWILRFEFTLASPTTSAAATHNGSSSSSAPRQVFHWEVPIDVVLASARPPSSLANIPYKFFTGSMKLAQLAV